MAAAVEPAEVCPLQSGVARRGFGGVFDAVIRHGQDKVLVGFLAKAAWILFLRCVLPFAAGWCFAWGVAVLVLRAVVGLSSPALAWGAAGLVAVAAAGIAYRDDSGRVADFHSLRHTFISRLAWADVHVKTAQRLARHSDPALTLNVYSHISMPTFAR